MKKLLIGLMLLTSMSTFANEIVFEEPMLTPPTLYSRLRAGVVSGTKYRKVKISELKQELDKVGKFWLDSTSNYGRLHQCDIETNIKKDGTLEVKASGRWSDSGTISLDKHSVTIDIKNNVYFSNQPKFNPPSIGTYSHVEEVKNPKIGSEYSYFSVSGEAGEYRYLNILTFRAEQKGINEAKWELVREKTLNCLETCVTAEVIDRSIRLIHIYKDSYSSSLSRVCAERVASYKEKLKQNLCNDSAKEKLNELKDTLNQYCN